MMAVSARMAAQVVSPLRAAVPLTSATFPFVAERLGAVPEVSAVGRATPVVADAVVVWTRKYWPGWMVAVVSGSAWVKLPVAEAYWTERPAVEIADEVGL